MKPCSKSPVNIYNAAIITPIHASASLRRKGSFAQTSGPRLGENTNSEGC